MPGQCARDEVHQDVSQRFHVVPPTLLYPKVSVDGSVSRGTSQVLVLPVGDVLVTAGVSVLFCEAKVNDVDQVALLSQTPAKKDHIDANGRGHLPSSSANSH